ncbi:hypothetical protein [Kaistia adipata]|uniref:hypothetical protein n=1 Tax=Kaistia adipata TaxID=166954 RepID=UPI0004123B05|nr:hypothetical protein [Kaistia adipata]
MEVTRINEDLIDIGGKVRVERGPARKTGKATEALLDDEKTASHYQLGKFDADGKVIEAGKTMTYLDWLGPKGWYVYALGEVGPVEDSFHDDEAAAVARGTTLASA